MLYYYQILDSIFSSACLMYFISIHHQLLVRSRVGLHKSVAYVAKFLREHVKISHIMFFFSLRN